MISEHLMRPGSGTLQLRSDTPTSISDGIREIIDERDGGPGGSLVITPARLTPATLGDAATLAQAFYLAPIVARPSRLSLTTSGLSSWLDTYIDTDISRTSGTPSQWLGDLLTNGLTSGTVTGAGISNVTRTFLAHSVTYRQALDAWASLAGAEYKVNPDLTVDVAVASTLFESPPTVVVTRNDQGATGRTIGVAAGLIDQSLTQLGPKIPTKAVVLGQGVGGAAIVKGTDTTTVSLKSPTGGTPAIVIVQSAPSEATTTNANTLATSVLNLNGDRRAVKLSSRTYGLPRLVTPGDEVYVYDPSAGLYDHANVTSFNGETIYPAQVRVLSLSWPIEQGMGVYVRPNAAAPAYLDISDFVAYESDDTWWTIGDWSPPSYGPANRSAPEIEERIAAPADSGTYTPTLANMAIGTGGGAKNTAEYRYANGMLSVWGEIVFGTSGATLPAGSTETIAFPSGFTSDLPGNGIPIGTVRMTVAGDDYMGPLIGGTGATATLRYWHRRPANDFIDTLPPTATTPATWAAGDIIAYQFSVPASRT